MSGASVLRVPRPTRFLTAVSVVGLLVLASGPVGVADAAPSRAPAPDQSARPSPTVHGSDGRRGPVLQDFSEGRLRVSGARTGEVGWEVAPGLSYAQWTQLEQQGPVRVFVLTAQLDEPGLVLDHVGGPAVPTRAPLSRWVSGERAVAAVNADFFDIHDTGAPLGVGADRQRRLLHAPVSGWNTTFLIDSAGRPRVQLDRLVATVVRRGRPVVRVSNLNSPTVAHNGVGLYTSAWGRLTGRRVVEGARRVRQVVVRGGVVRANRIRLSRGRRSGVSSSSVVATELVR